MQEARVRSAAARSENDPLQNLLKNALEPVMHLDTSWTLDQAHSKAPRRRPVTGIRNVLVGAETLNFGDDF